MPQLVNITHLAIVTNISLVPCSHPSLERFAASQASHIMIIKYFTKLPTEGDRNRSYYKSNRLFHVKSSSPAVSAA